MQNRFGGLSLFLGAAQHDQMCIRDRCAIVKDGGDDIDATTGLPVVAEVTLLPDAPHTVTIDGGAGVGRVTKPDVYKRQVPHLVKQALGSAKPLHVLPGCALGGASFCLLCDLIAVSYTHLDVYKRQDHHGDPGL